MKNAKNKLLTIKIIKDNIDLYMPSNYKIKKWANMAFKNTQESTVTFKLSKSNEIMKLNKKYFNKNKACNVLSFPNNSFLETGEYILGDIIICPNIVNKESAMYNKDIDSRWAHMVIHSMLHVQGYKHKLRKDKFLMEKKERELMKYLGYPDPYYAN